MDNISGDMGRYIKPNNDNPANRASQRSTNQMGSHTHARGTARADEPSTVVFRCGCVAAEFAGGMAGRREPRSPSIMHRSPMAPSEDGIISVVIHHSPLAGADEMSGDPRLRRRGLAASPAPQRDERERRRECPRPPARCTERGAPLVALSGTGRREPST